MMNKGHFVIPSLLAIEPTKPMHIVCVAHWMTLTNRGAERDENSPDTKDTITDLTDSTFKEGVIEHISIKTERKGLSFLPKITRTESYEKHSTCNV